MVEAKKQIRRPKMSEMRPYRGWTAVEAMRYAVVSQDALFVASNSELMTAYVAAMMVPSNALRNTLFMRAI